MVELLIGTKNIAFKNLFLHFFRARQAFISSIVICNHYQVR